MEGIKCKAKYITYYYILSPNTSIFLVNNAAVRRWHAMYIVISQDNKSNLLKLQIFLTLMCTL